MPHRRATLTYLGIPLTIRRPTAAQLQPLVAKMAAALPTWKAKLMNKTGRLAFTKAVLSAIPLHQLLVLNPPKKILKQLQRIQRAFLWEGGKEANGGSCHVNWDRVCRPTSHGGLGVPDMERTDLALRMRWQWLSRTDDQRAWHGLDLHFPAAERAVFFASTSMAIGNGRTALFWEDRWIGGRAVSELAPQLYDCVPKRRRKTTTVAAGLEANSWARDIHGVLGVHEVGQYLCLWQAIAHTKLAIDSDRLVWKWSPNGVYSAQSCYRALFHGSLLSQSCKLIWKTWAPPRVKFHHWLAAQDRCWTAARDDAPPHRDLPLLPASLA
jgi:hypothetical protein